MCRISDNLDLPVRIVMKKRFSGGWRFEKWGMDQDDMLSAANEGLLLADEAHDENRGSFRRFASKVIIFAIIAEIRRYDPAPASLRMKIRNGEFEDILYEPEVYIRHHTDDEVIDAIDNREFAIAVLRDSPLTDTQRRRVINHYIKGIPQSELAEKEGCKRGGISTALILARNKMKKSKIVQEVTE